MRFQPVNKSQACLLKFQNFAHSNASSEKQSNDLSTSHLLLNLSLIRNGVKGLNSKYINSTAS